MALNLRPVDDYAIAKKVEAPPSPTSGLYVHNADANAGWYGEILAVGPGRQSEHDRAVTMVFPAKVGDTVLFHHAAGMEVKHLGESYMFVRPTHVLARVT